MKQIFIDFYRKIGLIPSIIIGVILLVLIFFGIGGISLALQERFANNEIQAYKNQAATADATARQAEADKTQAVSERDAALGESNVYKQQALQLQNELADLQAKRQQTATRVEAAHQRSSAARQNRPKPITDNDADARADALSQRANELYPDK